MQLSEPYFIFQIPGIRVVAIDILQRVLIEACAEIEPRTLVVHPADAAMAAGLCCPAGAAPTGRCANCLHEVPGELCAPSIGHLSEWQDEWGVELPCPYWECQEAGDD